MATILVVDDDQPVREVVVGALARKESRGGHFREEYQTDEGEALRDDDLAAGDGLRAEAVARVEALQDDLDALLDGTGAWAAGEIADLTFAVQSALVLTG